MNFDRILPKIKKTSDFAIYCSSYFRDFPLLCFNQKPYCYLVHEYALLKTVTITQKKLSKNDFLKYKRG